MFMIVSVLSLRTYLFVVVELSVRDWISLKEVKTVTYAFKFIAKGNQFTLARLPTL